MQLTQAELTGLLPQEPGVHAHCQRVCAMAAEIGHKMGIPPRTALTLEHAALIHHTKGRQPLPENLAAVLQAFHLFPKATGDESADMPAQILALANLLDERIEGRWMEGPDASPFWNGMDELRPLFRPKIWDAARALFPAPAESTANWNLCVQAEVASELIALLNRKAPYSLPRVATLVSRDPAIAGQLVQAANSPLFAARMPIRSVPHAISYLGMDTSRRVLTALVARSMFGSSAELRRLWMHSLRVAQFLESAARELQFLDPAEALLTGLVHDVGRIAMARQREAERHARLAERGAAMWAETLIFGMDHAEMGARILESWRFPEPIVNAVRFHHMPADTDSPGAAALYAAEFWSESDEDLPSARQLQSALRRLGCGMERFSQFETSDAALTTLLKIA